MALFKSIEVGAMSLKHRIAMPPLTRLRAVKETLAPGPSMVEYYSQRASEGGLLITEATCVSVEGVGIPCTPGIWTTEQAAGWKKVTDAVHAKGGKIFVQLWHMGRVSHESYKEHPLLASRTGVMAPSAVGWEGGEVHTTSGMQPAPVPRALTTEEVKELVGTYAKSAKLAVSEAGFDGVEIHSAHGYLLDQFLCSATNKRTDEYGGSVENRVRLLLEVVEAVSEAVGSQRVAVRLSPTTADSMTYHGAVDEDPVGTYSTAVEGLNRFNMAYLLLSEPRWDFGKYDDNIEKDPGFQTPLVNGDVYRKIYKGVLMGAGGFTPKTAVEALEEGTYDMIAFGRWFIANPDLPEKIRTGAPLNRYNRDTFYAHTEVGYTDYPTLEQRKNGTTNGYNTIEQGAVGATLKK